MDVPLDVCLQRLATRRSDRGEHRVIDPKLTTKRFNAIARTKRNFIDGRFRTVTLSDNNGANEILELFRAGT
jgi:hypothetical protein